MAGSFVFSGEIAYFSSQFGPPECSALAVNNVVGLSQADAVIALESNQFVVNVATGCYGASAGTVASQSPAGGTILPQGWPVTISVEGDAC